MMKNFKSLISHIYFVAFFVAFLIAVYLIAIQRQETLQASVPIENRTIILESLSDKNQVSSQNASQQHAKISPLPGEIFLKTIDIDIDDDEDFEQVILCKKTAGSTVLWMIIADFSSNLGVYLRHFEAQIQASKLESITIQPLDVTGDGLSDLLIQGLDSFNNQTLTIFRRHLNRGYSLIFSEAGLSINLQDSDNLAIPSIVVESLPNKAGFVSYKTYRWNRNRLILEKISESPLKESNTILEGPPGSDAQSYLLWLKRLWTKNSDTSNKCSLYLDTNSNALILEGQEIQQRWIIKSAERNGNRLYLTCRLSELSDLDRIFIIDARGQNEILISIIDQQVSHFRRDEGWSGRYKSFDYAKDSPEYSKILSSLDHSIFLGRYLGDNHSVLVLDQSKSILVINGKYREGAARVYDYDGYQLLDFLQIQSNGLVGERLLFIISIDQSENGSINRLILRPAEIGPEGARIEYRTPYIFIKTS